MHPPSVTGVTRVRLSWTTTLSQDTYARSSRNTYAYSPTTPIYLTTLTLPILFLYLISLY
jgi:hypothetical protein